jgi:phosphoribosylformimino-5-aminoimidazole carboxamide ribonucleotide (ProFAR) isomerase
VFSGLLASFCPKNVVNFGQVVVFDESFLSEICKSIPDASVVALAAGDARQKGVRTPWIRNCS